MTQLFLSVDVEQDCPPFLSGHRGMEEGLPKLLRLFAEEAVPATFFVTGEMARRYPESARAIVAAGHELGCHGDSHRRFDAMDAREAESEIRDASAILREHYPVVSFRAPNLAFPPAYYTLLEDAGYRLDSSEARYKLAYYRQAKKTSSALRRVPASVTSSALRLPRALRFFYLRRLKNPVVLFVHPWEFVDLTREKLRWDCRVRTGDKALSCLREVIHFFKARQARFQTLCELLPDESETLQRREA